MAADTIQEQLVPYLADAHSIEEQAIAQLRAAPDIAGEPRLAAALDDHLGESEEHERLVRGRLEAHGGSPSKLKDAVMKASGPGFVLFAKSQPDTPGKLATHAYSYEHLELAAYELLLRVARRAGDEETVAVAQRIRDEEAAMGQRIEALFDATTEASLAAQDPDDSPSSSRSTSPTPTRSRPRPSSSCSAPRRSSAPESSRRSTPSTSRRPASTSA